eukprot:60987_1
MKILFSETIGGFPFHIEFTLEDGTLASKLVWLLFTALSYFIRTTRKVLRLFTFLIRSPQFVFNYGIKYLRRKIHNIVCLDEETPVDQDGTCIVCMESLAIVAFVPCGHMKMCEYCASIVHECPLCRGNINSRMRIYI